MQSILAEASLTDAPALLFQPLRQYQRDPFRFVVEQLRDFPWSDQKAILEAAVDDPLLAVRSAKGVGKTRLLAWLILWIFYCWEDSIVITTATTWTQVRNQLWREIHRALERARRLGSKLPGKLLDTSLELGPKWFALGVSTKKPESMAGFHADTGLDASKIPVEKLLAMSDEDFFGKTVAMVLEAAASGGALEQSRAASGAHHEEAAPPRAAHDTGGGCMTVAVDEASGIDEKIDDAIDGLATTPNSHLWRFGNPTRNYGRLFDIFHPMIVEGEGQRPHVPGRDYRKFTIDARRAPASIISPMRIQRAIEAARRRGYANPEDDPQFQIDVMGLHAVNAGNLVFPRGLLEASSRCRPKFGGLHLHLDVARQGGDSNVATLTDNLTVVATKAWSTGNGVVMDYARTAQIVAELIKGWKVSPENVHIEVTGGMGWAVWELLRDKYGFICDAVEVSAKPSSDWDHVLGAGPMFKSRRQQLIWILMRLMEEGLFCLPNAPKYAPYWADLQALQKPPNGKTDAGFFEVESSDSFRERTGRSPDYLASLYIGLSRTGSIVPAFGAV